jgi:hypothetical protein
MRDLRGLRNAPPVDRQDGPRLSPPPHETRACARVHLLCGHENSRTVEKNVRDNLEIKYMLT